MIDKLKNNTASKTDNKLSEQLFRLKKTSIQTGYLVFTLADIHYGISTQNINDIITKPALVYSSHMSPPIVGMQHYNDCYIPVMDFAGYRSVHSNAAKILVLSKSCFRKDNLFALLIDNVNDIVYASPKDLTKNNQPFNNLLPSYFFAKFKNKTIYLLDINDLANQLDFYS